jgi:hypothetical protein
VSKNVPGDGQPPKFVLHIKAACASKAHGHHYMLGPVRMEAERRLGRPIPRKEIVTAGDRMGTSPGEDDDSPMVVLGGRNYALGVEACDTAASDLLGTRSEGMSRLLDVLVESTRPPA